MQEQRDRFLDLKALTAYSGLGLSSLRYHIETNNLPVYRVKGPSGATAKILVRKSEFDAWMQAKWKTENSELDEITDSILAGL